MDLQTVTQQVRDCCHCFECADDKQWMSAVETGLALWGELTCGNWLDDHKLCREIDLAKQCGGCCPKVLRVAIPETWVKPDTFKVTVRLWHGIETEDIPVKSLFDDCSGYLLVDLTNVTSCCDQCARYDLHIEYEVGVEELPDEFCRWFCYMAKVYMLSEELECAQCSEMDEVNVIVGDETKDLSVVYKQIAMSYFQTLINQYKLCLLKSFDDCDLEEWV